MDAFCVGIDTPICCPRPSAQYGKRQQRQQRHSFAIVGHIQHVAIQLPHVHVSRCSHVFDCSVPYNLSTPVPKGSLMTKWPFEHVCVDFIRPILRRLCGMLSSCNTGRRSDATCRCGTRRILGRMSPSVVTCVAMVLVLLAIPRPAESAHGPERAVDETDEMAVPDAAEVVAAYLTARRWLDAFELPAMDDPAARQEIADASGLCVHLRRSGRVIGTGVIAPTPHIESGLKLRRALGRAMSQVLGDSAVSRLPEEMRDEVGESLVLELEVAGPPEPLIARSYEHVARQVEPGLHGVALRRGDRWAMQFPSQLLATNGADRIAARLATLVEELGVTSGDLRSLVSDHNVSVYRFRTSHLVQPAPDKLPRETYRGDQLVLMSDVTPESISATIDALVRHILQRSWPHAEPLADEFDIDNPPVLLGDYRPVSDRYDPLAARPFEQALTAFVLVEYASSLNADFALAGEAAATAVQILLSLRDSPLTDERQEHQPATQAAALYALEQLDILPADVQGAVSDGEVDENWSAALSPWADELTASLLGHVQQALVPDGRADGSILIGAHTMALMTAALARRAPRIDDDRLESLLRDGLDALWDDVPSRNLVGLLPWIGWAERDLARATGEPVAHLDRLSVLREALYDAQVGFAGKQPGGEYARDLHGGFVLADRRRPDAQSVRPMIWLAEAAREQTLSDPELWPEHERRLLGMMRFLMQLAVRESANWSLRNPERAIGGVRNAIWDRDQPLVAQAMALLACVEINAALRTPPEPR